MIHRINLGKIGYQAYAASTGGKTFDGRDMPAYEDLPDRIKEAWGAAGNAIDVALKFSEEPTVDVP
jgi:hypothetical protein